MLPAPTKLFSSDAGDLTIGPVSAATVIGIAAGICLLLLLLGLLLAMRYHRQNRDRLIDLDALVRQLTLGSEGTPGTHPSPHTPHGRIISSSATPSSMYTNAAFQASRREAEAAMLHSPRDSRGASTAPGAVFSGGTSRPFGSVSGLRDSPPARRTIRPPAPGHVPLSADEFSRSYSAGGAVGEDTSATHVSAAMSALGLGSQGSAGERVVWRSPGWQREPGAAAGAATGATAVLDAALDTQSSPGAGRGHLDTTLTTLPERGAEDEQFADVSTMREADARAAAAAAAKVADSAAPRAAEAAPARLARRTEQGEIRAAPRGVEVEMAAVPPDAHCSVSRGRAGTSAEEAAQVDPLSSQTDGEFFSIMSSYTYGMPGADALIEGGQPGQVWATVDSGESSSLSRGLLGIGGAIQEGSASEEGGRADSESGSAGAAAQGSGNLLAPLTRSQPAAGAGDSGATREKLWMSIESAGMAAEELEGDGVLTSSHIQEWGDEPRLDRLLEEVGPGSGSASAQLCKEGFSSPLKQGWGRRTGAREDRAHVPHGQRSVSRGSMHAARMDSVEENPWSPPPLSQEDGCGGGDSPSLGNTYPAAVGGMEGGSHAGDGEAGAS